MCSWRSGGAQRRTADTRFHFRAGIPGLVRWLVVSVKGQGGGNLGCDVVAASRGFRQPLGSARNCRRDHALDGVGQGNVVATGEVALTQRITVEVIEYGETAAGEEILGLGGRQERQ